jgi:hypothetical protein
VAKGVESARSITATGETYIITQRKRDLSLSIGKEVRASAKKPDENFYRERHPALASL